MPFGQVAQLVEQRTENPRAEGSSPPLTTISFREPSGSLFLFRLQVWLLGGLSADGRGFHLIGSNPTGSPGFAPKEKARLPGLEGLAEEVGFEPTEPCGSTVFKTAAFNHSAIPPLYVLRGNALATMLKRSQRIPYNAPMTDEDYMRLALEQAREAAAMDEVPIGAVVVYNPIDRATRKPVLLEPQIIAKAFNQRETQKNPAGHAEFAAMLEASRVLDAWRLSDCTVYVTLEPCIMCAGLMHQARIDRCVYGAPDPKAGAAGSLYRINEDARLNHNFEVTAGVLEEECAAELRSFFARKRKHNG